MGSRSSERTRDRLASTNTLPHDVSSVRRIDHRAHHEAMCFQADQPQGPFGSVSCRDESRSLRSRVAKECTSIISPQKPSSKRLAKSQEVHTPGSRPLICRYRLRLGCPPGWWLPGCLTAETSHPLCRISKAASSNHRMTSFVRRHTLPDQLRREIAELGAELVQEVVHDRH